MLARASVLADMAEKHHRRPHQCIAEAEAWALAALSATTRASRSSSTARCTRSRGRAASAAMRWCGSGSARRRAARLHRAFAGAVVGQRLVWRGEIAAARAVSRRHRRGRQQLVSRGCPTDATPLRARAAGGSMGCRRARPQRPKRQPRAALADVRAVPRTSLGRTRASRRGPTLRCRPGFAGISSRR